MSQSSIPIVNLVPTPIRLKRRRHKLVMRWCVAIGATFAFVGVPGLYLGGNAALGDPLMGAQIDRVREQLSMNQGEIPRLQSRIGVLEDQRRVLDLVRNRIDWQAVFSRVVDASDDQIRFTGLFASGGGVKGEEPVRVRIDGIATTQTAARSYVVSLESLGLFDHINLERTARRDIDGQEIIEFQIFADVGDTESLDGTAP